MPNMAEIYNIPGASPHEILYTNGDNAPTPDRVVVPKIACGQSYSAAELSKEHDGAVASNPYRARYDNYGNRWLEGGFEYPPYEGHAEGGPGTLTSDDVSTEGNEAEAKAGPTFQANGDEKPVKTPPSEQTGEPTMRPYKDQWPGPGVCPPNLGTRADKWPATGLTNFKHPQSNSSGHTNSTPGS